MMAGTGFNRKPLPQKSISKEYYKSTDPCACGSSHYYSDCCEVYHQGVIPPTAEKTLRARYTAYAMGLSDFIIETSHPKSSEYLEYMEESQATIKSGAKRWAKEITRMSNDYQYLGFELVSQEEVGTTSNVTFRVLFREADGSLMAVEEKSTFRNENGRWLYFDGETEEPVEEVVERMNAEWPSRPINMLRYAAVGDGKKPQSSVTGASSSSSPLTAPKLRAETLRESGGLGLGARITHIPKGRA